MKIFATILTVAALVGLPNLVLATTSFTNCATTTPNDMNVTSFTGGEWCVGEQVTMTAIGTLSSDIILGTGSAKLAIAGWYLGRIMYTDTLDLCALLAASGNPCPVPTTVSSFSFDVLVKATLPTGIPMQYRILATNGNGNTVFCQQASQTGKNCVANTSSAVPTTTTVAPTTTTTTVAPTATPTTSPAPTFTNCATGPTDMDVSSFTVGKWCVGGQVTMSATGILSSDIILGTTGSAKLHIIGKYFGTITYRDTLDLCALLTASGNPCPVPKTVTSLSLSVLDKSTAPSEFPMQYTIGALNGNGNMIFCQQAVVSNVVCA